MVAASPPRKRACAAERRSIGVTELSGLPGSEGYADCDDAESKGFLFVATKRNPSGVPRWVPNPPNKTVVRSFSRDGALRRSAYRVVC